MSTKSDFETAALLFDDAAQHVSTLTAAAQSAGAADILRGGSLGRQVPELIATSAETAAICEGRIQQAAETCRQRVSIIADYEDRLVAYDRSYYHYERYSARWGVHYNAWFRDETGLVTHPGARPRPPNKPTPPPSWATVRRP